MWQPEAVHESEDWDAYFRLHRGRPVRQEFLTALALVPATSSKTAIDLGAGDGTETRHLLRTGWHVLAIDATPGLAARVLQTAPAGSAARLTIREATFAQTETLPSATFVYAGMSLPFCSRDELIHTLGLVAGALTEDGVFAGHFLGAHDDWTTRPGVTTLTGADLAAAMSRFTVLDHRESEYDGPSGTGPKHWHTHFTIAKRRRSAQGQLTPAR